MGVHPDLRAHRDRAAAHHQPGPGGVGRPRRRPSARSCSAGPACPPSACASPSTTRARCWPAPTTSSPATGSSPTRRPRPLEGGWFHTGDGGYLDGAYVVISDRKKDVIITGGENVSSIEVEDCLYQHAAVAEVAVIGVPDEKWGETVKALVVVRDGRRRSTEAELIAHCRDRLAHFKAPTSRRVPRRRSTARRPASSRSTSCASPTGPGSDRSRQLGRRSPRVRASRYGGRPARALLEHQPAAPVEGGGHLAADEPAQRIAHDGAAPALVEPAAARHRATGRCRPGWPAAPWSKSRSSAIWRTTPEHTATAAAGAGASRPSDGMRICSGPAARPAPTASRISRGPSLGQVAAVDAAGATQFVDVVGRPLRDRLERQVGEHHAPRPVALGRRALTPGRHLLGHGALSGATCCGCRPASTRPPRGTGPARARPAPESHSSSAQSRRPSAWSRSLRTGAARGGGRRR